MKKMIVISYASLISFHLVFLLIAHELDVGSSESVNQNIIFLNELLIDLTATTMLICFL